jgi:hypothetical protein
MGHGSDCGGDLFVDFHIITPLDRFIFSIDYCTNPVEFFIVK